jgi:lysophospholipase L1-like esterase
MVLGGDMNAARIGLVSALTVLAIGVLAAGWSYLGKDAAAESHRYARQIILYYTLSRAEQPIIVVGDSLTEASTLPRTLCGHAVVNAGLNGASAASDLGTWLTATFEGRRAAAILVALGTNDALLKHSARDFEKNYLELLTQLSKLTDRLTVLGIPAVEVRGRMTAELQSEAMNRIDALNAMLPALAAKGHASFIALPPMPSPFTIDGVHLDSAGYAVWDDTVLKGVAGACGTH